MILKLVGRPMTVVAPCSDWQSQRSTRTHARTHAHTHTRTHARTHPPPPPPPHTHTQVNDGDALHALAGEMLGGADRMEGSALDRLAELPLLDEDAMDDGSVGALAPLPTLAPRPPLEPLPDLRPAAELEAWQQLVGDYDETNVGSVCCEGRECLHGVQVAEDLAVVFGACSAARAVRDDVTRMQGPEGNASAEACLVHESKREASMSAPAAAAAGASVRNTKQAKQADYREEIKKQVLVLKGLTHSDNSAVGLLCDRALCKVLGVSSKFLHSVKTEKKADPSLKELYGRQRQVRAATSVLPEWFVSALFTV
jgi:hypothetical protein